MICDNPDIEDCEYRGVIDSCLYEGLFCVHRESISLCDNCTLKTRLEALEKWGREMVKYQQLEDNSLFEYGYLYNQARTLGLVEE